MSSPRRLSHMEQAVRCPICLEDFSLFRYPIISPTCSHTVCVQCGNTRKSHLCAICNTSNYLLKCDAQLKITFEEVSSESWKRNFALLSYMEFAHNSKEEFEKEKQGMELKMIELGNKLDNNIDYMKCPKCETKERRERMMICVTCADVWTKEWKGMKEEEILPFISCGCCGVESHSGHSMVKYLPWKMKELVTTTVSKGKATVSSMNETCAREIEKGKEELVKWNEKMNAFGSVECETFRDGLTFVASLKKESDLVCRASEDTLPTLRMYTKVVTDSISRLDLLKKSETVEKKEND